MSAPTRPPSRPAPRAASGGGTAARRAARAGQSAGGEAGRAAGSSSPTATATAATRGGTLDPDALAALEEQRDFLLRSLRDLEREHDAGDLDDGDYEALKDDYTARAAAVLRAIEGRRTAMAARPRRRRGRSLAIAGVVVLAAVLAGVVMAQATGRRSAGDAVSGDTRQTSRELLASAQAQTGEANQALERGDGDAAVEHFRAAIKAYDDALQADPLNAEAMTYRGWLLHTLALNGPTQQKAQLDAEAMSWLDRAIEAKPDYADPHVFKAILLRNDGRLDEARAELAEVRADQIPPFMQSMVSGLRSSLEAPSSTAGPGSPASVTTSTAAAGASSTP